MQIHLFLEENLQLFREMRDGKYAEGEKVLRAKIDMAHPNMLFHDPLLYRILHAHHHWVSTEHAKELELRLYDKLFTEAQMGQIPEGQDYKSYLYGTLEAFVAKPQAKHLKALCPEAHIEIFKGLNHGQLLIDHPDQIAEMITCL